MLGKYVRVKVVKPIGSDDEAGYTYPLNFGTVYGNEKQTAFIMGIHHPVRNFDGRVIAVMSDKKAKSYIWIVAPKSTRFIINDIKEYINLKKDFPSYRIECLYESSCGAVVYRDIRGEVRFLLIKNNRSAHWGFPKGHIEPGETKQQTAYREVLEETGIHITIHDGFECVSKYKIRDLIEKTVSIFVGTTKDTNTSIQVEEIEDYIWLTYDRAMSLLKFDNDKNILSAAYKFLNENNYI
ncbi:MAG: NUDIX domain-containing protein [Ruminococcaceae bacterium]|nr:NUDIX domain-containing protein [Oscillospiraceae bacterium]